MKLLTTCVIIAITAGPALAGGHTDGRVKALTAIATNPNNGSLSDAGKEWVATGGTSALPSTRDLRRITSIFGDKGRGNGNEPFAGFADHDPGIPGGNGGD